MSDFSRHPNPTSKATQAGETDLSSAHSLRNVALPHMAPTHKFVRNLIHEMPRSYSGSELGPIQAELRAHLEKFTNACRRQLFSGTPSNHEAETRTCRLLHSRIDDAAPASRPDLGALFEPRNHRGFNLAFDTRSVDGALISFVNPSGESAVCATSTSNWCRFDTVYSRDAFAKETKRVFGGIEAGLPDPQSHFGYLVQTLLMQRRLEALAYHPPALVEFQLKKQQCQCTLLYVRGGGPTTVMLNRDNHGVVRAHLLPT